MTTAARRDVSADQLLKDLDHALRDQGIVTDVIEPSTRLKVFAPNGQAYMDEILTLAPDDAEILTWHWSWGAAIGPASEIGAVAEAVRSVVCQVRA